MDKRIVCWSKKRKIDEVDDGEIDKVYKFRILIGPSSTTLDLTLQNPEPQIPLEDFMLKVREEYNRACRRSESTKRTQVINWNSGKLFIQYKEQRMRSMINLKNFKPHKMYMLHLCDGSGAGKETFQNMWDLTPDTDLLTELPEEYTFETALADLVDNSLQAVWSNGKGEMRLISVDIMDDRISIFDSGPGMDDSDENSIVKWGKMGASLHRSSKGQGIGGKPPYLMPFFGMFGYGGPIASMQLGRAAVVSSKTKESKKVFSLHLEREVLLSRAGSDLTWRTDGGIRDPLEEEIEKSPHRSFTKVEIFEPKRQGLDMYQLQCRLKDIYFPYIQCDEESSSRKTVTPIAFQVNGTDLAEIDGGEIATTNLHSCNGPDFVFQLHFSHNQDTSSTKSLGLRTSQEANARLKCVYFPIIKGKEEIEGILEELEKAKCGVQENFETFSRVSIRRLGRLLPDARWTWLPFMEPKKKKGMSAQLLRRCCKRVKCFVETDAGFSPTPSKTDLAHHNPFTIALKNLGNKPQEKEEVNVKITKDGNRLSPLQLEKVYQKWVLDMHAVYDEESGEDCPVYVVSPQNKKSLGVTSEILRVHQVLKRKEAYWRRGQKIKIVKGACTGFNKNNVYATIEYFILEGFEGDASGEARMICRPLNVPDENGCVLEESDGNTCICIRNSSSLPVSVIDSGKCLAIETTEWDYQLEKQRQGIPSMIDLLTAKDCQELEFGGVLPDDVSIQAGHAPPTKIVAVIRPASFLSSSASKRLDQKFIVNDNIEMSMEIKFRRETVSGREDCHVDSKCVAPSSHKGLHGFYIFPLQSIRPLFMKAGVYTFLFSLTSNAQKESICKSCVKKVIVKGSSEVGKWCLGDKQNLPFRIRVGSRFPPFSIACYDIHDNQIQFSSVPKVSFKLQTDKGILQQVDKVKTTLSTNRFILKVEDIMFESNKLDKIQPSYEATLMIFSQNEMFSVSIPCQVAPGSLHRVSVKSPIKDSQLFPGCLIKELTLEMFDAFGNHVESGLEVQLDAHGFIFLDQRGPRCKVNEQGCIDLGGLLKVTGGYGQNVSISVVFDDKVVFKQEFGIEKRVLRLASEVQEFYTAGSKLENIVFEVVNSEGIVDVAIHDDEKCGQSHTLTIDSSNIDDSIRYAFRKGRCTVPVISLPLNEGSFSFVAAHSRHPELRLSLKIPLIPSPKLEQNGFQSPCSDRQLVFFQGTPTPVQNLIPTMLSNDSEIIECGRHIGDLEQDLSLLEHQKKDIKHQMSTLQDSLEPSLLNNMEYLATKEEMVNRLESRAHSASALICCLSRQFPFQDPSNYFMRDIIGLVVLLGTVCTSTLSRILAEYLGEDQMLAIVCRSHESVGALEKYTQNGEVDCDSALHAEAVAVGRSINGRFLAMCLEDIRPYTGNVEDNDQQRKLSLPTPTTSDGYTPAGFLGYAVNMINLGPDHVHTRTSTGHGLRETVLYRLFGKIQVYETRKHMIEACGCIKDGAVSLDGGILKENGIVSLGYGKPDICFPVECGDDIETMRNIKQLEEKLSLVERHIKKRKKAHEKALKKLKKKQEKHSMILDIMETVEL